MDLRQLSFDEMCQMDFVHATATNTATGMSTPGNHTVPVTSNTMLPIMMIPTSLMPPGTIFTTRVAASPPSQSPLATAPGARATLVDVGVSIGGEHYYQLQPTHILATATANTNAGAIDNPCMSGGVDGNGVNLPNAGETPAALLLTPTNMTVDQQQRQFPQQQLPQSVAGSRYLSMSNGGLNILYAGTLTRPGQVATSGTATLTRQAFENGALPRSLPSSSYANAFTATDESDFEGSECNASISATTCIPHFRFGGCGMILQPTSALSQQQHQQQYQRHQQHQPESQAIGCGSFSHMMGSFATMQSGLSGTLGRSRRGGGSTAAQQIPKRVSFKAETMQPLATPQPALQTSIGGNDLTLEEQNCDSRTSAFNNCSYMNFDHFMNTQTTGFGGLPDVTEHSNTRRTTLSRQNSMSTSDSGGEIAVTQKPKVNFGDINKSAPVAAIVANAAIVTTTSAVTNAIAKRKSKASQRLNPLEQREHRYKATRRSGFVLSMTLIVALCLLAVAATLAYQHFLMAPSRNSHTQRLRIVRRILREVPLVDGHNNFAWNVRKYAHSSLELVYSNQDMEPKTMWTKPSWAQTDMERLRQGLVGVQVWSAYVPCEAQGLDAVQLALEQIDIIRRLSDIYGQETTLVTSSKEIVTTHRRGQLASLIGIEGGHTIGSSLGVLRSFYSLGARYLSLTHRCDVSWAGSSASLQENGLTQFGKAIIREMNRLGMMIDLSYSSDATARDVLQATRAPVIFSHSAARQLCNSTRNIPDDILRLLAENGGLIMISFDSEDVSCGRQAQLNDVIAHINYVKSIAGVQHIGLGAGYDGIDIPPVGLEDVSKYPDLLATLLEDPNWSEDDIAKLAGKNFMRIMETVENVRDYWKRADIQPIEQTEPQPKTQCTYMAS